MGKKRLSSARLQTETESVSTAHDWNQAVLRLLRSGKGEDSYEQEADRLSEQVMKSILCFILILVFSPLLQGGSQKQDKYNLNPTPDPTSRNKIYVPTNLEDAFGELKKMLHPDLLKEIKEGSEQNMSQSLPGPVPLER